jgi:hypothetical protein
MVNYLPVCEHMQCNFAATPTTTTQRRLICFQTGLVPCGARERRGQELAVGRRGFCGLWLLAVAGEAVGDQASCITS